MIVVCRFYYFEGCEATLDSDPLPSVRLLRRRGSVCNVK